jgi:hypothetical protein
MPRDGVVLHLLVVAITELHDVAASQRDVASRKILTRKPPDAL